MTFLSGIVMPTLSIDCVSVHTVKEWSEFWLQRYVQLHKEDFGK